MIYIALFSQGSSREILASFTGPQHARHTDPVHKKGDTIILNKSTVYPVQCVEMEGWNGSLQYHLGQNGALKSRKKGRAARQMVS